MKKILFVFGLMLALGLRADSPVMKSGSDLTNVSRLGLGNYVGAVSYLAVPFTAQVAITKGMPVKASGTGNNVSITTAAGSSDIIGIATNTAAVGATVWVAVSGVVPGRFPASMTTTAGVLYTGTSSGDLTPTSTVTGSTQSARAISIVYVIESKIVGPDGLARCIIVR